MDIYTRPPHQKGKGGEEAVDVKGDSSCKETKDCAVAGGTVISSSVVDEAKDCCGLCAKSSKCVISATAKKGTAAAEDYADGNLGKKTTCTLYSSGGPATGTEQNNNCYVKNGSGGGGGGDIGCSWSWGPKEHGHHSRSTGFTNATDAADIW